MSLRTKYGSQLPISKAILNIMMSSGLLNMFLINHIECSFRTYANFTENYSAIVDVFDLKNGDQSRDMRVTLLFENLPIDLEDEGGMWLGIGFGSNTMLGADIVICQWDDIAQRGRCGDYLAESMNYPANIAGIPRDEVNNVRYVSGIKADNKLELKFRRYLQTGDSDDFQMQAGWKIDLIWAYGYPDRLYHGSTNRGFQSMLLDQTVSYATISQQLSSIIILTVLASLCISISI